MPQPPLFKRSPREWHEIAPVNEEIPAPPPAPVAPLGVSAQTLLMPMLGLIPLLASTLLMGQAGRPVLLVGALLGAVISVVATLLSRSAEKRNHARAAQMRVQRYRHGLHNLDTALQRERERQATILSRTDPDPMECLARVERLDPKLWERSPVDSDFLEVRLGLGSVPFRGKVTVPSQPMGQEPDPLYAEARELAGKAATLPDMPVCASLVKAGVTGVAGEPALAAALLRAMVMEIATHHSPVEVKLAAAFPAGWAGDWAWLRWLPHTHDNARKHRYLATDRENLRPLLDELQDELTRRRFQAGGQGKRLLPYMIFVVPDARLLEQDAVWPVWLGEGPGLGCLTLVLSGRRENLPKECRAVITLNLSEGRLAPAGAGDTAFAPDAVSAALADRFARAMAPVRTGDAGTAWDLPAAIGFLDLWNAPSVDALDVARRWRESEPHRSLAVPLGVRAGREPMLLDVLDKPGAHGPHGLVAGATGSGKSELLQTLILSLAVSFHPHDLGFVLIDYKGGGMSNHFGRLPHHLGTLTNLEGNLANRALLALKAELTRRQRVLGDAGYDHISDYQKARRKGAQLEPLPHLLIISDEFAQLKMEQPDFIRELVAAVRIGRSLGVHLILATQKPAGVVDDQIWGNTRFRLCLRVERPEDSREVLKRDDAADIRGAGRAYFQVGNNERFDLFQTAWGGAPYIPDRGAGADRLLVREVALSGARKALHARTSGEEEPEAPTQLKAVVDHVCQTAARLGIQPLPGPWLKELRDQFTLGEVRPDSGWDGAGWRPAVDWLQPVIGMADDPRQQRQDSLAINLGKEGHLIVYGAPGTGKTTFLQTLITSLALSHSPRDLHMYLVDGGGRSYGIFRELPHAGGIVASDDTERVQRLFRFLEQQLEERKERFTRAGVTTFAGYRQTAVGIELAAIFVSVDNYPAFAQAYPEADEILSKVAAAGGNLGIHLALTAGAPSAVKSRVSVNIAMAAALQLADRGDYSTAVGRSEILPFPVAGRGLVKGSPPREFQTALPAPGGSERERSDAIQALAHAMAAAWTGSRPWQLRTLPDEVPLQDLIRPDGDRSGAGDLTCPIGLAVDELEPFTLNLNDGPSFLVLGPVESGKTTLLRTAGLALAVRHDPGQLQLMLVDFRGDSFGALRALPHLRHYARDAGRLQAAVEEMAELLQQRRAALEEARTADLYLNEQKFIRRYPALVMLLDDYDMVRDGAFSSSLQLLEQVVRRDRGLGFYLLAGCSAAAFESMYSDGLAKALREAQTGFVLGSRDTGDLQQIGLPAIPGDAAKRLAAGVGYFGRRGRARKVKVATAAVGGMHIAQWVALLQERSGR